MDSIEFTREHLYEIEKHFDYQAGLILQKHTPIVEALSKTDDPSACELLNLILKEMRLSYVQCREISAIAQSKRKGD